MQNHIKKEATILEIDKRKVIDALRQLGARKVSDTMSVIEMYDIVSTKKIRMRKSLKQDRFNLIFEKVDKLTIQGTRSLLSQNAYLCLCREGRRIELILKYGKGNENMLTKLERKINVPIRGQRERQNIRFLLQKLGLKKVSYQEKCLISYVYDPISLRFDIETWPGVPTYVRIEGVTQSNIKRGTQLLGYNISDLRFYKMNDIFQKYSAAPIYMSFSRAKVKIKMKEILYVMRKVLRGMELSPEETDYIIFHYLDGELAGRVTHGIYKFCWDIGRYDQRRDEPRIVSEHNATALVDGRREIGPLAAKFCVKLAIQKAKRYGIAVIGLKNFQRYGVLSTFTKGIAAEKCVGIVFNTTYPFAAFPTKKLPVLGTNPISIAVPTKTKPVVLDMSTTKAPMNLVGYESMKGGTLPANTFFSGEGNYTTDPLQARLVETWGGIKGFNLSFMLQLLAGPLLGVKIESSEVNHYEVGAIFIAIDPSFFSSFKNFQNKITRFITFARQGGSKIPGEYSFDKYTTNIKKKFIILPQPVWDWLNLL